MKIVEVLFLGLLLVGIESERIHGFPIDQHQPTAVIGTYDSLGYEQAISIPDDSRSLSIHVTLTVLKTALRSTWPKLPAAITNTFKLEQVLALLDLYYTVSDKAEDIIQKVLYHITCQTPIPGCSQTLANFSAKVIMWLLPI